jgi:triacylglycerol lipase
MRRLTAAVICLAAGLVLAVSPAHAAVLPVPYNFLPAAILGGSPDANAPGTNDWSCKPTSRHPRPVVLVHGTLGNRSTNWQTYGPLLKNNGYCVFALTYGSTVPVPFPGAFGGLGKMETSAQQLKTFVAKVLNATGASKVDLVGHSQGTLMPDYWLKYLGGAGKVGSYISLAPLWHGTGLAGPPSQMGAAFPNPLDSIGPAFGQMSTGSAFMTKMRSGTGVRVAGVKYVNIMTKYDELVKPYTSGSEPGMTNIVIQDRCPQDYTEHFEIAADKNASILVLNALDPTHPRPLVCSLVLPFVGGL